MTRSLLLGAALAFGSVGAEEFVKGGTLKLNWKDCGDASTHGKVQGLSPDSLTLGQKTTVTGTGTIDEAVTAGSFTVSMKAGIISKNFKGDICSAKTFDFPLGMGTLTWDGIKCPLAKGPTSLKTDLFLSGSIPASLAKAEITMQATASNGDKLVCMEIDTVPAQLAVTPGTEAKDVAIGLIEGFLSDDDLKHCVKGAELTFQDIEQAVKDFEKKDAADVLKGLRELAAALKAFPSELAVCKAAESDIKKLVDALKQLTSPEEFAYHVGKNLLVNHHDIFTEIFTAVKLYKAQQYENFGMQLGEALRKLIIGVDERFDEFCALHNKNYSSPEERQARKAIFADNYEQIYNIQQSEPGTAVYSYLSPFSDMSPEEFSWRNGFMHNAHDAVSAPLAPLLDTTDAPDNFDWVAKGAVNAVKNQQQCGSCWAFATVANIEGAGFVEHGKLVSLSEQELVDCDKKTGDMGCKGGLPSNAYKDMIANKFGLETETAYPYTARDGTCGKVASKEIATIGAWQTISQDEDQIAAALVKYGPLAIGINAGPMQFYHGGIANPWKIFCNPKSLDHGVAIVAYGVENSKKYWKIRNSWGPMWGEKGYYRIIRGTGACGLNTMVTTATGIQIKSGQSAEFVV